MPEDEGEETALFEARVGTVLRDARESRSLSLEAIAKVTRVPQRHLENIENGDYENLPAATYSTGFVKAFAREVGLDQNAIGKQFREEISFRTSGETASGDYFEPADPARVPPRSLAWIAAAIALILAVGYGLWRSGTFGDDADDRARLAAGTGTASIEAGRASASGGSVDNPRTATAAPAAGPVVLEAQNTVWLRIYNLESDERIYEAEMQPGDRFEIPANAQNPAILTGRPDALRVTVGGRRVAPLGPAETTISGVSLLPADLVGRRPAQSADDS